MKKLFTLLLATIVITAAMARQSQVSINIEYSGNPLVTYEVMINGNYYNDNSVISNLYQGQHTLQVYETTRTGLLGVRKKRTLKSSTQFQIRNYDLQVNVDRYGQARVNETGYNGNDGWNDNNGKWDRRNDDRRYDNRDCNGRGNKYGHYKKGKHGKNKWDNDNRRREWYDDDDDR